MVSAGRLTSRMHSAMRVRQYSMSEYLSSSVMPEPDVLEDVHRVEQRAVLEDVADAGAELGQLLPLELAHLLAVHDDGAAVRPDEADDVLEQHALAGARWAQQRHRLALAHLEVDPVQHHLLAEALVDVDELDHWLSRSRVSTVSSTRISTELVTTAVVVDLPTPSAPCWVLNPM